MFSGAPSGWSMCSAEVAASQKARKLQYKSATFHVNTAAGSGESLPRLACGIHCQAGLATDWSINAGSGWHQLRLGSFADLAMEVTVIC